MNRKQVSGFCEVGVKTFCEIVTKCANAEEETKSVNIVKESPTEYFAT